MSEAERPSPRQEECLSKLESLLHIHIPPKPRMPPNFVERLGLKLPPSHYEMYDYE